MSRTTTRRFADDRPRSAFTLVELLVVIAIIGILIAMLLPAVQAAREAARRMQCKNNLKQIGLALHNYHDSFNSFPPGWIVFVGPDGDVIRDRPVWGWGTSLLPFLERKPLFDHMSVNRNELADLVDTGSPAYNPRLLKAPLEIFLCSSSKSEPLNPDRKIEGIVLSTSNYVGCAGFSRMGEDYVDTFEEPYTNSGVLFGQTEKAIRFGDITDGTSNVFAVGERTRDCYAAVWCGQGAAQWDGSALVAFVSHKINEPGFDNFGPMDDTSGLGLVDRAPRCRNGFSSYHPDGANFLMCDGSARFVNQSIEYNDKGFFDDEDINDTDEYQAKCPGMGIFQYLGMREDGFPIAEEF